MRKTSAGSTFWWRFFLVAALLCAGIAPLRAKTLVSATLHLSVDDQGDVYFNGNFLITTGTTVSWNIDNVISIPVGWVNPNGVNILGTTVYDYHGNVSGESYVLKLVWDDGTTTEIVSDPTLAGNTIQYYYIGQVSPGPVSYPPLSPGPWYSTNYTPGAGWATAGKYGLCYAGWYPQPCTSCGGTAPWMYRAPGCSTTKFDTYIFRHLFSLKSQMALVKTVSASSANRGDLLTYTINWTNTSSGPLTNVSLWDSIPANTSFVSASPSAYTLASNVIQWNLGTLAVNQTGSASFVVRINSNAPYGSIIPNIAKAKDSGGAMSTPDSSNQVDTTVLTPAVELLKTANVSSANLGDTITYTLTYSNLGTANATNVRVFDTIPAGTTYLGGSASSTVGSVSATTPMLVVNLGTLNKGFTQTVANIPVSNSSYYNAGTWNPAAPAGINTQDATTFWSSGGSTDGYAAIGLGAYAFPASAVISKVEIHAIWETRDGIGSLGLGFSTNGSVPASNNPPAFAGYDNSSHGTGNWVVGREQYAVKNITALDTWTPAKIAAMRIRVDSFRGGGYDVLWVDAMYVAVTYVSPSNLANTSGTATFSVLVNSCAQNVTNVAGVSDDQELPHLSNSVNITVGTCGTPTSTRTRTPTPSFSSTPSPSPSYTPSPSNTMTPSATATFSPTPTFSDSPTPSSTPTQSFTFTTSPTPTPTATPTPTYTASPTFSNSPTPSGTPTHTPTYTPTPTNTPSPTFSDSPTQSFTFTGTKTFSSTTTFTNSPTLSCSSTPTSTYSGTVTFTDSPSVTPSHTPTATYSGTATFSDSPTASQTNTESYTYTPTRSYTETPTMRDTVTNSPTPTQSDTYTGTASETPSFTDSATATDSPTETLTRTPSPTRTPSRSPTATRTITLTRTVTRTFSVSPTMTDKTLVFDIKAFYPNPFDDHGVLYYTLGHAAEVELTIYNVAGEPIWRYRETGHQGANTILWKGLNEWAGRVASGIYVIRLQAVASAGDPGLTKWTTVCVAR